MTRLDLLLDKLVPRRKSKVEDRETFKISLDNFDVGVVDILNLKGKGYAVRFTDLGHPKDNINVCYKKGEPKEACGYWSFESTLSDALLTAEAKWKEYFAPSDVNPFTDITEDEVIRKHIDRITFSSKKAYLDVAHDNTKSMDVYLSSVEERVLKAQG
jgi:hypothetical protein